MLKVKVIVMIVKILMALIAIGIGIWYMATSIGGAAVSYTSMNNFYTAIGVEDGNVATANGCFMCGYVADLFSVIGEAALKIWTLITDKLWILLAAGFGVYLFIHSARHIFNAMKETANLDGKDKNIDFKTWFEPLLKQGIRLMLVGALMGALGMGGVTAMKTITNITITPVLYAGAELSLAASGAVNFAQCGELEPSNKNATGADILNPVFQPFMCVIGNINAVMLAGAAGGFSMMNYAWMGLGGGVMTWLAGVVLVLMFMIIGFDLFFQILTVVFKLVFLVIFLPLIIASAAFEPVWNKLNGIVSKSVGMLVSAAVRLVAITLKVIIIYTTIAFTADTFFPGPIDGYSSILPPILNNMPKNPDAQTLAVINVFSECERSSIDNGTVDGERFEECFKSRKASVERSYPGAFDYLENGWDFLLMMICLFCLYFYAISPKVDKLLPAGIVKLPVPGAKSDVSTSGEDLDFGAWVHDLGKTVWGSPVKLTEKISKDVIEKD